MIVQPAQPSIVAFVSDLMFSTRIANVARHLNYEVQWVETATDIGNADPEAPEETPGERLHGREGRLFDKITEWQPALLLFDLNNDRVPWQQWMMALKSSPATRRIPIVAFGPHEDTERFAAARKAGSDAVYGRSRFTAAMPELLQKHARIPDHQGLQEACAEPLPKLALTGIELFNQGEFYRCHDSLEAMWNQDSGPGRDLYRGILQIGIAYMQIERGNYRGAVKMLLRARQWFEHLPDTCRGINIARLRSDAAAVYEALIALGPEAIGRFDRNLFKPIAFSPPP